MRAETQEIGNERRISPLEMIADADTTSVLPVIQQQLTPPYLETQQQMTQLPPYQRENYMVGFTTVHGLPARCR